MPIYQGSAPNIWNDLWGDGFMSPGGERNRAKLLGDRDIKGQRLLDIGCGGGGGPGLNLVVERGGELVGIDAEPLMVEGARLRQHREWQDPQPLQGHIDDVTEEPV